ncbi:hypothetical protein HanIR_Chr02g0055291 [Helianthus annuus]|nr:hypothetical protein HanIR_Chr02g0055291 [Helianthus annuus]
MPLPILEPGTSGKRWVSVANWATPVGYVFVTVIKAFIIYIHIGSGSCEKH